MRYLPLWFGSILTLSTVDLLKQNIVSNPGELVMPQQLLMQGYLWNYGVDNVIGLYLKAKNGT
jgi:hypothetical protein